jgi:acyl dehydratase
MAESSLITDEIRKLIGMITEPVIFRVEVGAIQRYAEAIGDQNPLFSDLNYAGKSKHGRVICPPGFMGRPVKGDLMSNTGFSAIMLRLMAAGARPRVLDAGTEYEFFEPIGAGDTLVSVSKLIDISERESKSGKMMVSTVEIIYVNQDGNIACKVRMMLINR